MVSAASAVVSAPLIGFDSADVAPRQAAATATEATSETGSHNGVAVAWKSPADSSLLTSYDIAAQPISPPAAAITAASASNTAFSHTPHEDGASQPLAQPGGTLQFNVVAAYQIPADGTVVAVALSGIPTSPIHP